MLVGNDAQRGRWALLGDKEVAGLRACPRLEELAAGQQVIVVPYDRSWDAAKVKELRRLQPDAHLIALCTQADAAEATACIGVGFDDIAVGEAHLQQCLIWWAATEALREGFGLQDQLHRGLVGLVNEISARPDLGDVLRTAVLRMAELFNIDRVSVVLFKPGDEVAFVVAEAEESYIDNVVIRIADYPEFSEIIRTGEPLVISDLLGDGLMRGVRRKIEQAKTRARAAMLFPLRHKSQVVGALFLRSREVIGSVEERLLEMGRLISVITSIAIGSALEHDTLVSEQRQLKRKKAEVDERLADLQQYSEFFAQAHDGIVITGHDGRIRYANAAAGAILRSSPDSLKERVFLELFSPHSHALAARAMRGDKVGDSFGYVDLLVPVESEEEIVVSAGIRSVGPSGVLVSFRDVTERREIETELRQTKEFLENLIQSSVDGIVSADMEGRIILFNRAAEQIVGYSARDVVGSMRITQLYPPGDAHEVMRQLRSDAYGGVGRLEMTRRNLVSKSGALIPVSLTASVIYEDDREVATVGVFTDLRDRLKMEEKLAQVQRQLQFTERQAVAAELAGAAAHELSQPLTSILGYAEMLRRRIPDGDPGRKPVDVICREAERMALIVKKIGQITNYQTKPYVGSSQIFDLEQSGDKKPPGSSSR